MEKCNTFFIFWGLCSEMYVDDVILSTDGEQKNEAKRVLYVSQSQAAEGAEVSECVKLCHLPQSNRSPAGRTMDEEIGDHFRPSIIQLASSLITRNEREN